jgi:replication factor C subunit 2/4
MDLFSTESNNYPKSYEIIELKLPWVEKYRPTNSNDLILDPFIKEKINKILEMQNIPNLIVTGNPSTGKTSTILFIANNFYKTEYSEYVLELNASDDKGLPIINNIIYPFCKKKKIKNKLVILDEADTITPKAQNLLSNILSEFIDTTRFVFICNDCTQIIESIQSKCMILKYPKINKENLENKIKYICKNENIPYDIQGINTLLFVSMDDIRQIINNLECIYYSQGSLTEDNVYKLIDKPKIFYIEEILNYCFNKDFKNVLQSVKELHNKGYTPNDILLSFMKYLLEYSTLQNEYKLNIYDILSKSYIIINENIDSLLQLYGCISNIYIYIENNIN